MPQDEVRESPSTLERISEFLTSIGLEPREAPLPPGALLPGVAIAAGGLVMRSAELKWPGDLLHEAGHIAVTPAALRSSLDGTLADEPAIAHAGEAEATAWAYAAVVAIGLDPTVLFHEGGYHGQSTSLAFTFAAGCYPGAAGLIASGMALSFPAAAEGGREPYPHMIRWLRE